MKKQNRMQLVFFTDGLRARLAENAPYLQGMEAAFVSGRRRFEAALRPDGADGYVRVFGGVKTPDTPDAFLTFFVEEAMKYESAALVLAERGGGMRIEADERGVRARRTEGTQNEQQEAAPHVPAAHAGRQSYIRMDQAADLLRAIGILTQDGKLKNDMVRKYNQIDHFVELVAPMLEANRQEVITVLDCACGKSYLGFVLNYYIREVMRRRCHVTGVDISPHVIEESRRIADTLGYKNMTFHAADLRTYHAQNPGLVISLHACDTATDMAIGLAVRTGAQAIACVPCCHRELLDTFRVPGLEAVLRHGVLRARANDLLTDGLRALKLEACGYRVRAVEYVSPLDTPKNLLITAVKEKEEDARAAQEYRALCTLLSVNPAVERECRGVDCTL